MSVKKEVGLVMAIKRHVSCSPSKNCVARLGKDTEIYVINKCSQDLPVGNAVGHDVGCFVSGQKREWEIRQYAAWPLGSWYGEHGEEAKKVDLSLSRISQSVML